MPPEATTTVRRPPNAWSVPRQNGGYGANIADRFDQQPPVAEITHQSLERIPRAGADPVQ